MVLNSEQSLRASGSSSSASLPEMPVQCTVCVTKSALMATPHLPSSDLGVDTPGSMLSTHALRTDGRVPPGQAARCHPRPLGPPPAPMPPSAAHSAGRSPPGPSGARSIANPPIAAGAGRAPRPVYCRYCRQARYDGRSWVDGVVRRWRTAIMPCVNITGGDMRKPPAASISTRRTHAGAKLSQTAE